MITFIIPNRGGKHIDYVIKKHKELYKDAKFIVISQIDDKPFLRGQLFNIAMKYVKTDYVCLIDNDVFFNEYIDFENIYNSNDCVVIRPVNNIQQVKISDDNDHYEVLSIGKSHGKGAVCFLSTKQFKNVNGFSNVYYGWGYEDNDFFNRCNKKYYTTNNTINHIKHPKNSHKNVINRELNKLFYSKKTNSKIDGYNETKCDVLSIDKKTNDVTYINVTNIGVDKSFKYKNLIDLHFNINNAAKYLCSYYVSKCIDNNYILVGLPKHMNLGDTIIWDATEQFLNNTNYKCLNRYFTNDIIKNIDDDTIIVFNGGGFLSDIWPGSLMYIHQMLLKYHNNKFVFLPNSVFFKDTINMKKTFEIFSQHNNSIIICNREEQSFNISDSAFKECDNVKNYLVPDLVLGWDINKFINKHNNKIVKNSTKDVLFISRNDRELVNVSDIDCNVCSD